MKIFNKKSELSLFLNNIPKTGDPEIGFVPTMGALHRGHIELVRQSVRECGVTVVSIFVNPTQFNDPADLRNYPRTPKEDLEMLEAAGVEAVYAPAIDDIYPEPDTRVFDFGTLDKVMEGVHRPGHFNGVAQVVSRLFEIVNPDRAYFGEKDFQQLAVIRALVKMTASKVLVVGCPIVRDDHGLALSSRNALLSPEQREVAPLIYKALNAGAEAARGGATPQEATKMMNEIIDSNPILRREYFEIVDSQTLLEVTRWGEAARYRACAAVFAGRVRLIDNIDISM